eukprot:GFUD01001441.1.p1 GENE.GFUD01001441.1~~GFUD01001441.1.p1  ORF type:complete len:291 (-),score=78.59 GFUD01001441.1:125-943(-)
MVLDQSNLASEYLEDILSWLKDKETNVAQLQLLSPQLGRRRQLVDWSSEVAVKLRLTTQTLHLAVKLLDHFMDGHDIEDPQLYLVCLGCLQLAAKMNEKETNIPRGSKIVALLPEPLSLSAFLNLEFVMLNFFQWDICMPTSCYLTELLLPHSIHQTDRQWGRPIDNFRTAKAELHLAVKEMLDIGLQEETMMQVVPSLMACSILQASRLVCGMFPDWPDQLDTMTGYTRDQLELITDSLVSLHKLHGEEVLCPVDEGYHSNISVGYYSPEK